MRRNEQGFTTVFIALALVSLLGASAFALDLGQAYTSRRQMQNAADAGALAARDAPQGPQRADRRVPRLIQLSVDRRT